MSFALNATLFLIQAQLETIPGQKGYLVISTDGAVVQV